MDQHVLHKDFVEKSLWLIVTKMALLFIEQKNALFIGLKEKALLKATIDDSQNQED